MSVKISIITINYNNPAGLKKTIDSIAGQGFRDFEYLVIDGGSTAGDVEIIRQTDRIDYWVSEKDNGVYHAMNKGIQAAKGAYIIFMNSGDYFYDDAVLENASRYLDGQNQIVFGNTVYFNGEGYRREEIPPDELSFSYFLNFGINHQASFIKRTLFFENFLYNETYRISSDWEFFLYTICLKNVSYKHIDQFICYYDFSGVSADPKNNARYFEERDATVKKYFPLFYQDYKIIGEMSSKRMQQVLHIKKSKTAWRIMKWIISLFLLFLPQFKRR